jgi:hypothetical protein
MSFRRIKPMVIETKNCQLLFTTIDDQIVFDPRKSVIENWQPIFWELPENFGQQ